MTRSITPYNREHDYGCKILQELMVEEKCLYEYTPAGPKKIPLGDIDFSDNPINNRFLSYVSDLVSVNLSRKIHIEVKNTNSLSPEKRQDIIDNDILCYYIDIKDIIKNHFDDPEIFRAQILRRFRTVGFTKIQ